MDKDSRVKERIEIGLSIFLGIVLCFIVGQSIYFDKQFDKKCSPGRFEAGHVRFLSNEGMIICSDGVNRAWIERTP